jgi:DNA-binding MarR family transcriptional regulator
MPQNPSRTPEEAGQLADQLTRAFRRLRAGAARELAPLGLTFSQSRMLRMIGRAEHPLRIGDVASLLEIAPRSATGMVDSLEEAGLATRRPDDDDRRSVLVELTPRGRGILDQLGAARRESANALFSRLTSGQRAELRSLLELLNATEDPRPTTGDVA